jgi:hypothetical protein
VRTWRPVASGSLNQDSNPNEHEAQSNQNGSPDESADVDEPPTGVGFGLDTAETGSDAAASGLQQSMAVGGVRVAYWLVAKSTPVISKRAPPPSSDPVASIAQPCASTIDRTMERP